MVHSLKKHSLLAGIIITIASVVAIASAWRDAPIVDEIPHIGAGYSYVAGQTYQFNPEHPPLPKDLAGLALSFLNINPQIIPISPSTINDQWNFGRGLIYHSTANPATIVHVAKLPLILFFILSGWLIYLWTRKTYNSRAALLAVFLFAFCPTIIAHSRFVTTDVPALFGILLATYFFLKYLGEQSTLNFWLASLSFGVALLTKFSAFLLIPYFLILAVVWAWSHNDRYFKSSLKLIAKTVLVMIVGFVVVVGPIYQLHILKYPSAQQRYETTTLLNNHSLPLVADAIVWASDKPVLRPYAQWGLGMAMVFQRAEGGNRTYFLGQLSGQSFKAYFPVVYALKEPIPFLLLLLGSIWLGWQAWRSRRSSLKEKVRDHFPALTMLLWILIYVSTSINANLNIGVRHLIPIYGFVFILVAGQIEALLSKVRTSNKHKPAILNTKYLILGLLIWYFIEFLSVYPSYLSYFNQFGLVRPSWTMNEQAGWVRGGHNYVVDSNLDWGQDLWRLADWVKENKIPKIYLNYFGWAEQQYYLGDTFIWMQGGQYKNRDDFLSDNPNGGYLAISATFYEESIHTDKAYWWLSLEKPVAFIGGSIFVWHITP